MNDSTADKRRRLREHYGLCAAVHRQWHVGGYLSPAAKKPSISRRPDRAGLWCKDQSRDTLQDHIDLPELALQVAWWLLD